MSNEEVSKILVIVDDKVIRESIATCFSDHRYCIAYTALNDEAIECFHSFVPQLVLCDIQHKASLRAVSFSILEAIFDACPSQAVMVLADRGNTEDIVKAMRLGVCDYFLYPIEDMSILALSVRNNLRRARILEENRTYRKKLEVINRELERSLENFEADQQAGIGF